MGQKKRGSASSIRAAPQMNLDRRQALCFLRLRGLIQLLHEA